MTKLLDIEIETIDGDKTTLRQLGGTTYLIVNVASACGFTRQYEGMQTLYEQSNLKDWLLSVSHAINSVHKSPELMKRLPVFVKHISVLHSQ